MALITENPYLPVAGIAPDARGLTMDASEAADSLNFRAEADGLISRAGSTRLAKNVPSGDPIIHMHTYLTPDQSEILFGFTKNRIYKYSETTQTWALAQDSVVIDAMDAADVAHWTGNTPTTVNYGIGGKSISFAVNSGAYTMTRVNYTTQDLRDYDFLCFHFLATSSGGNNATNTITFKAQTEATADIQTFAFIATASFETVGLWQKCNIALNTDSGWQTFKKLLFTVASSSTITNIIFDHFVAYKNVVSTDVTHWSTTDFIDDTQGSTIIAAGSSPPKPGQEESDGAGRFLLYYDTSTGTFKPLTMKERKTVVEEAHSNIKPSETSDLHFGNDDTLEAGVIQDDPEHANYDSSFIRMVEGQTTMYSLEYGSYGTVSAVAATVGVAPTASGYPLVDLGTDAVDLINYGTNRSWMKITGEWGISFKRWDDEDLPNYPITHLDYAYERTSPFNPRFVRAFHNRLVFANTYEDNSGGVTPDTYTPWRVRWTRAGKMDEYEVLDYTDIISNDISPIIGMEPQGFYLNLFKIQSISRLFHVQGQIPQGFQDTTAAFNYQTIWQQGTYALRTISSFNQINFYLGIDDVYAFDGTRASSITRSPGTGASRIRDEIFRVLNQDNVLNCLGIINQEHKEYWLFIVKSGQTYPTDAYVFNILRAVWYKFRFSAVTSSGEYHVNPTSGIDDLLGTIDDQNFLLNTGQLDGLIASPVLAFSDGDTFLIDETKNKDESYHNEATDAWVSGSAITSDFVSRDFIYQDLARDDRTIQLEFESAGENPTVGVSNDFDTDGGSFIQKQTITNTPEISKHLYYPDVEGKHVRFHFTFPGWARLRWMQPSAIRKERWNR